jgi:ferredoxin
LVKVALASRDQSRVFSAGNRGATYLKEVILWLTLRTGIQKTRRVGSMWMINVLTATLCRQTAPTNFTRDEERGYSFVFKQPQTLEEESQCQEAMRNCPVEAIGDDGMLVTEPETEQVAV